MTRFKFCRYDIPFPRSGHVVYDPLCRSSSCSCFYGCHLHVGLVTWVHCVHCAWHFLTSTFWFSLLLHCQRERGETFFSFARDLTAMSSKAITRAAFAPSPDLDPWRQRLLWVSRVIPMPLVGLFVIEGMCAPTDAPLKTSPEMKALLDLDLPGAFKVFLAKQITTE